MTIERIGPSADNPNRPDLPLGQSYVVHAVHDDGWDVEVYEPDLRDPPPSVEDLAADITTLSETVDFLIIASLEGW